MALADSITEDRGDEGESPWPALADLLAATTLLFLVLFAVVAIPALNTAAAAGRGKLVLEDVQKQLALLARKNRVTIEPRNDYIVVRIAGDATFPVNEYTLDKLRPEGRQILTEFATAFGREASLLDKIEQIQVVGHTSTEGTDDFNWMLSAERAVSVSNYLIGLGLPACKVTALGRGRYYPVNPSLGGVKNPDDRRIELEIHPVVPADSAKSPKLRCIEHRAPAPTPAPAR